MRKAAGAAFAGAGVAISGAGPLSAIASQVKTAPPQPPPHLPRIAVFLEEGFPAMDGMDIPPELLRSALKGLDVTPLDSASLGARFAPSSYDVLVNPYGSAFPKEHWPQILDYLLSGGNFVNFGGVPFSIPVEMSGTGRREEIRQTVFHRRLGITQSFSVRRPENARCEFSPGDKEAFSGGNIDAPEVWEMYFRLTGAKELPDEDGSDGPRNARVRPLVILKTPEGKTVAAPVIIVERLLGEFSGGRWVLANFSGRISGNAIRRLVQYACEGASEWTVAPAFASYIGGETPSINVRFHTPGRNADKLVSGKCHIRIVNGDGEIIDRLACPLRSKGSVAESSARMTAEVSHRMGPGLYHVYAEVNVHSRSGGQALTLESANGFWVRDRKLLAAGAPLTCGKQYFERSGEPFIVTGATYMGADAHRRFLLEPNPHHWMEDFRAMKSAGVNMVRTGIWTGWMKYMTPSGKMNEGALRAFEAFLLTARSLDIPVIFTPYAFLPEAWGGVNPFLDPVAVGAQMEFLRAFVRRTAVMNDVMWDFINEPSFSSPKQLWNCRPNYDECEVDGWKAWLTARYGSTDGARIGSDPARPATDPAWVSRLAERYRCTIEDALTLPSLDDFSDSNIFENQVPLKVIDYRLFAQESFSRWVAQMASVVRESGAPGQLITVGQDEGGTADRPTPHFFSREVDFTCMHTWWYNDDLAWDNVMTGTPGKPNLVEETGVMFYEKMTGEPWRSEEEVGDLLERKLAIALGARGAGYIHWIWNTNPYMPSDNEAAIGFLRPDGTEKPELGVFEKLSKFVAANSRLMKGLQDPEVLMVIPQSQMFSTRSFMEESTKRSVRVMQNRFALPVRAASEYTLASEAEPAPDSRPKLIVLPYPRTINEDCWSKLMEMVKQGSTLLVSGPIDTDDHWMAAARSQSLGVTASTTPVAQEEALMIAAAEYRLGYREDKLQRLDKAVIEGNSPAKVLLIHVGKGTVLWSPLPVELAEDVEATVALYRLALRTAEVAGVCSAESIDRSVLLLPAVYDEAVLFALVSEGSENVRCTFTHHESSRTFTVDVPARRTAMAFVRRKDGEIISQFPSPS